MRKYEKPDLRISLIEEEEDAVCNPSQIIEKEDPDEGEYW